MLEPFQIDIGGRPGGLFEPALHESAAAQNRNDPVAGTDRLLQSVEELDEHLRRRHADDLHFILDAERGDGALGDARGGEGEAESLFDGAVPAHCPLMPVVAIDHDVHGDALLAFRITPGFPGHGCPPGDWLCRSNGAAVQRRPRCEAVSSEDLYRGRRLREWFVQRWNAPLLTG